MITKQNSAQRAAAQRISRDYPYGSGTATGFGQLIDDILTELGSGEIGITSLANDVDSLALGGGAFTVDPDLTTGLTFALQTGRFHNGLIGITVAPGTLTLTPSTTNYVEVDNAGTVHVGTAGFTAGRMPLYTVITSSGAVTSYTSAKDLMTLLGPSSVTGTLLSAAAASRSENVKVGTLTATSTYTAIAPCTGKLTAATLIPALAVATSDTNYWQVSAINLLQTNAGTQALLATTAANSTKATGGSALAVNIPRPLTLTTLTSGTELNVTEGDVIAVTFTATGAPSALTGAVLRMKFSFSN